jgi:hypothetical protein
MSEHTPEPWSYSEQRGSPGHCTLAQVWDFYGNSLAVIEATDAESEATALARLMAAAPNLLDALELLWREVVSSGNGRANDFGWPKAREATVAAITKAKGEVL